VNRHFQAKRPKYSNFHIIETTAWIPTKFCMPVKTTKCASWWSRNAANKTKMADSHRFEKSEYQCSVVVIFITTGN